MAMEGGYPTEANILSFLGGVGVEIVDEDENPFIAQYRKYVWGIVKALRWAITLSVYCPSATTFNVRGGKYLFKGEVKTYTAGSAVNPTDNDTTYVWMKPDNTIGSGIDGDGWPTTEHIKLAEVDVDSSGNITDVRDMRGQAFLQYVAANLNAAGTSVEALPVYWDSPSPADDDEIRIPIYANNDGDTKKEFARIVVKLNDVTETEEDSSVSISKMIAGALTSLGEIVGTTANQSLSNKTIDGDQNTVRDMALDIFKTNTDNANKLLIYDGIGNVGAFDIVCSDNEVVCSGNEVVYA